jgi:NADH-quinone oxidoreductase subunit G
MCTNCAKGCNTTEWLKAKPEWAKGSRLVRLTPRYNPEINSYWMCDLGRFGYHWVESEDRVRTPLAKTAATLQPLTWRDAMTKVSDSLTAVKKTNPDGVKFLLSAHASHEELFLFRRIAEALLGADRAHAITVSWRTTEKPQPAKSTFRIPAVDAPNVNGARMLGLAPGEPGAPQGPADLSTLRALVDAGKISALYVFDPGPEGSIGDLSWIVAARASGRLPLLIVQGVLMTDIRRAADVVLPGASSVEKQASYSNEQGRLQGTARAIPPQGEALEDWKILTTLATALGLSLSYETDADIRAELAAHAHFTGIDTLAFAQPVSGRTWLDASNPSERWKWEVMYQDLPPVKGTVDPSALPPTPVAIPLREVK